MALKSLKMQKRKFSINFIKEMNRTLLLVMVLALQLLKKSFSCGMEEKLLAVIEKIKDAGELERDNIAKSIENFSYIVESLLSTEGIDFKSLLRTDDTLQDDEGNRIKVIDRFEQYLVIGFWGIMYYAAKSLVLCKNELNDSKCKFQDKHLRNSSPRFRR